MLSERREDESGGGDEKYAAHPVARQQVQQSEDERQPNEGRQLLVIEQPHALRVVATIHFGYGDTSVGASARHPPHLGPHLGLIPANRRLTCPEVVLPLISLAPLGLDLLAERESTTGSARSGNRRGKVVPFKVLLLCDRNEEAVHLRQDIIRALRCGFHDCRSPVRADYQVVADPADKVDVGAEMPIFRSAHTLRRKSYCASDQLARHSKHSGPLHDVAVGGSV
ncbi:hypothetical protein [Micromonospora craniellae]|uniref:hypothetical protein n=1 Tax=Micromonospora craniellae TaxID=2294034 RepID=UPI00168B467B|nr:hypothetical protein [Micromonospora craniellae]QOC94410.1 hypothetical protein ID554_12985 [Micromonospora craniellae]